jgi:hypothetical protein
MDAHEHIELHLFFEVSRLRVRHRFGRFHIPILQLQLWTREIVILALPICDTKVQKYSVALSSSINKVKLQGKDYS